MSDYKPFCEAFQRQVMHRHSRPKLTNHSVPQGQGNFEQRMSRAAFVKTNCPACSTSDCFLKRFGKSRVSDKTIVQQQGWLDKVEGRNHEKFLVLLERRLDMSRQDNMPITAEDLGILARANGIKVSDKAVQNAVADYIFEAVQNGTQNKDVQETKTASRTGGTTSMYFFKKSDKPRDARSIILSIVTQKCHDEEVFTAYDVSREAWAQGAIGIHSDFKHIVHQAYFDELMVTATGVHYDRELRRPPGAPRDAWYYFPEF